MTIQMDPTVRPRFRLRLARYPAAARTILAHLAGRPAVALDAGCGKGRLGYYAQAPQLTWYGLDIAPERLARARSGNCYRLVRGSLREPPFAPEKFDAVSCIQVLEHFDVDEATRLARSLGALVRPGGLLLLSVPIFPAPAVYAKRFADWALQKIGRSAIRTGDHLSHFTLGSATRLVPPGFRTFERTGQRLFSLPGFMFEDYRWYYRVQGWLASQLPALAIEVNLAAVKSSDAPSR